ncbi:hypothetical protein EJA13_14445 [Bacillus canaveralius]|nr:hypothetical protein EJA13_14445 [Bacillus canaveralius]
MVLILLNCLPAENRPEVIERRIDIFTEELGLDKEKMLLWGYAHTVLSTSWSVEDNGKYDKTSFDCIAIFEALYKRHSRGT